MHALARFTLARAVLAAAAIGLTLAPSLAHAKVMISVDLDAQTVHVQGKSQSYDWKVSSGQRGYDTPTGTASVLWMDKDHHSDEYDQAPMPNAIFFAPGYAIHGASKSHWGQRASHGCVRLPVAKSAILWDMVKAEGGAEFTITGDSPETMASVRAKAREKAAAVASNTPAPAPLNARDGGAAPDAPASDSQYAAPRRGGLFGSFY